MSDWRDGIGASGVSVVLSTLSQLGGVKVRVLALLDASRPRPARLLEDQPCSATRV